MSNLKATKYQSIFKYFQNILKIFSKKKIQNKKKFFSKCFQSFPNFVKTLKIRVKLILNCPQAHAITYTPISKNVVGENGEWQLSNGNCTTERNCGFHICKKTMSSSQPRRQQKPQRFAFLTMETVFLHALHVHFSSFDILKTSSFFL